MRCHANGTNPYLVAGGKGERVVLADHQHSELHGTVLLENHVGENLPITAMQAGRLATSPRQKRVATSNEPDLGCYLAHGAVVGGGDGLVIDDVNHLPGVTIDDVDRDASL